MFKVIITDIEDNIANGDLLEGKSIVKKAIGIRKRVSNDTSLSEDKKKQKISVLNRHLSKLIILNKQRSLL